MAIRAKGLRGVDADYQLKKQGGTSWLGVLIALIAILVYAFTTSFLFQSSTDYISSVKDGTFYDYPNNSVGNKFDHYFENPVWKHVKSHDGNGELIRFTGEKESSQVIIDFLLSGDSFDISRFVIDDVPLLEDEIYEILYYIYNDH